MDRLSYTALSGMRTAMTAQTVTANNLANAATTGFRRDYAQAAALQVARPDAHLSRVHPNERQAAADFSAGAAIRTGRPLDVAMQGGAFLAVQAADGAEAYTRRGDLKIAPSGLMVNGDGTPVLGRDGPITVPPATRVEIGPDGSVSVQPEGAVAGEMLVVGRLKLVTPDPATLQRRPDGLFTGNAELDDSARLEAGQLEGSNVDPAGSLVDLMEQARSYEIQVRLLTTARDLDQAGSELLRRD
jgi:flagellar basal-body rod protein FlgF